MKSKILTLISKIGVVAILMFTVSALTLKAENVDRKQTNANIYGQVTDVETGKGLPYVTVMVKGTLIGTMSDATGNYVLKNLPIGNVTVSVSAIGYFAIEKQINVIAKNTKEINFQIKEDRMAIDEVVVTSNRKATLRKLAPTLVGVVDGKLMEETQSNTLAQGLKFQSGVRVEDNCQNCGFSQVRINGLDGHYSQILINSRPIFSALNGIYGLEQIPANMIDRVEVVRGGGSALYGASAVAGTINIITKEPSRNSAEFSHNVTAIGGFKDIEHNTTLNTSIVSSDNNAGLTLYAQSHNRPGHDVDKDGYSEIPNLDNKTIGMNSFLRINENHKLSLDFHSMHEYRRGGNMFEYPAFRANIAEQVKHYINGGGLNYDFVSNDQKDRVNAYVSFQHTLRRSFYGGTGGDVDASDLSAFAPTTDDENEPSKPLPRKVWESMFNYGKNVSITAVSGAQYIHHFDHLLFMPANFTGGLEYTYDSLDNIALQPKKETEFQKINIYSGYLQNEWVNDQVTLLFGLRMDKHSMLKKPVFSPRVNFRFNPNQYMNFRLSYSTGFRAPQIFDEELHVDLVQGATPKFIVRDPKLKPEMSQSVSASGDFYATMGSFQANLLVEGFWTRINGVFVNTTFDSEDLASYGITDKNPNYEYTLKRNGKGASIYGANLEGKIAYKRLFELQGGLTIQKSIYDEAVEVADGGPTTKVMLRTPNSYGYFTARLRPTDNFVASLSGTYTGSMMVPHELESTVLVKTPKFFTVDTKLAYTFDLYESVKMQVSAGIQNITNSYQSDFDKGGNRDSAYIYGPTLPRCFFAGVKFNF